MKQRCSRTDRYLEAGSGIVELMDDLGRALAGDAGHSLCMMGGGNPALIPAVQAVWQRRLAEIAADESLCERVLTNYDPPSGNAAFRGAVAASLRAEYGWEIGVDNVSITPGGQAAFFFLFQLLGGTLAPGATRGDVAPREVPDSSRALGVSASGLSGLAASGGSRSGASISAERGSSEIGTIVLPIVPEYIGYADQGLGLPLFQSTLPRIERLGDHRFKYRIDFDALQIGPAAAALCVSRPTNPTGNVLTDEEIGRLHTLARERQIPLIIDNAYGAPFPNALFEPIHPIWDRDIILTLSLSKLGLPGTRTGIVIAEESIARKIAALTAIIGLANGNLGQAIVRPALESGELLRLSREVIQPFYREKSLFAQECMASEFRTDFPWAIHQSEGAFFLWLWLPELPITSRELYQRLKARGVLVVPGEYFFFGLPEAQQAWPHSTQCIRITFSQPAETVATGLRIMADELRAIHRLG
jgi:valine--pyruvate aminotransferase